MQRAGTKTGVRALAQCSLTQSRHRSSRLRYGPHPARESRDWRKLSTFGERPCLATPTTWPISSQVTRSTSWLSRMIAAGRPTGPAGYSRTDRRNRADPKPRKGIPFRQPAADRAADRQRLPSRRPCPARDQQCRPGVDGNRPAADNAVDTPLLGYQPMPGSGLWDERSDPVQPRSSPRARTSTGTAFHK